MSASMVSLRSYPKLWKGWADRAVGERLKLCLETRRGDKVGDDWREREGEEGGDCSTEEEGGPEDTLGE